MSPLGTPTEVRLETLYASQSGLLQAQRSRYERLLAHYQAAFGTHAKPLFISAPGRIEVCGNHTDHQHGRVLTAAASVDTLAAVSPRNDSIITVNSEGHQPIKLDLNDPVPAGGETGSAAGLVRGIAHWLTAHGYPVGGFDSITTSAVVPGGGLSSSAAFEVLICTIFSTLYPGGNISAVQRAQCAQYAENKYFGKPSGLMDQMASSMGGMIAIDFGSAEPGIEAVHYDFAAKGYAIVVVNTGGSHGDLTDSYAAIPREMCAVAQYFGKTVLKEVSADTFFDYIPMLRKALPLAIRDRAILRAQHFYEENNRVLSAVHALRRDDLDSFFANIIASGRSSALYLQNIFATPQRQEITLALMAAETLLSGKGAWRIHGGGFAGTTLNFVPLNMLSAFTGKMEALFGANTTTTLFVRPQGPVIVSV